MVARIQQDAASALVDALAALAQAEAAVQLALVSLGQDTPAPGAVRPFHTTAGHIMAVLALAKEPLELRDIADRVCALKKDTDTPKSGGGTRYGELCRLSVTRQIERGRICQVAPAHPAGRPRFMLAPGINRGYCVYTN